ncbi:NUDIX domain-containing protein (plasmid) [Streptomyces globisporus]|uniref:NUDIX hydrolase n=1 Tax=Streptomyces globisporus TaxID=1908 RepID=UPI002F90B353|nr:NUDIX domain-containing protein [Streptomyces globisporus]
MPPPHSHIRELVTAYLGRHPDERPALEPLLKTLDVPGEVTSRATLAGHITCSAAVIDHDGRVLHVRHNASGGKWLLPGGDVGPGDATLMAAAVREVHQKTGILPAALCQSAAFCHEPADIDVHPAKGEPFDKHYDFRFVFHLVRPSAETNVQAEEVSGTDWLPMGQVTSLTMRSKLLGADISAAPEPVNASVTPDMLDRLPQSPGLGDLIRRHAAQHPPATTRPAAYHRLPADATPPAGTELHVVGVHLFLQDADGRVLLGLRHPDSAYAGRLWHSLAGHCEREDAVSSLIREADEEAGLLLDREAIDLVHLVHSQDSPTASPRIQLFFRARSWSGVPQVREPDRCLEWRWFNPKDLPDNTVPYTQQAIEAILAGRPYSDMGWT